MNFKIFYQTTFFLFLIFLFSCNKKPSPNLIQLNDIIEVHDEVMPMMDKIDSLQTKLRGELSKADDEEIRANILDKLTNLEKADKAMYSWMDGFKTEFPGMSQNEIDNYIQSEKVKVTEMANIVKNAISAAESK